MDYSTSNQLTPTEAQLLNQYQLLVSQLNTLSLEISNLTKQQQKDSAHDLANNLRNLEMKIGLIHTLFKGAVYTLFVDQES